MPYYIRITDDAVYHNGEFVRQNPPALLDYKELILAIDSNTSPGMETEPVSLTKDMLENRGMKLFMSVFGSDRPAPDEPVLLEIANPVTRMIPFEIMHDGNDFLARTVGVARIYPTDRSYEWSPLDKRMSVLAAFAGPLMYEHLDDPEHSDQPHPIPVRYAAETFRKAISSAYLPAAFTLRRHLTRAELQTELKKDYQVFHFTGHGGYNGVLLEDEHGFAVSAESEWLKRHLRRHDLRLAVLNSCETAKTKIDSDLTLSTQFVDLFHDLNVPFTVGMQFSIQQKAGNAYMQEFYRSLLAGASFLEAVQEARDSIMSGNHSFPFWQFLIPVAHVHPDMADRADERRLFASDSDESKKIVLFEPDLPEIFSYRRNEQFVGRCKELAGALKMLDPSYGKKILMLHGEGGMGKTALAIELAFRAARWYPYVWWTSGRKNAPDSRIAGTLGDREAFNPVHSDAELFFNLASEIGAESKEQSIPGVIRSIHEKLKNSPPSLLILDNMEHFSDLHHLLHGLPGNCKAVLTSRVDIQEEKHMSEHIPVRKMLLEDAFRLIHTIAEDLQLDAWWGHYGKISEVSKGHAQTIHILTRQLDNNDPEKRKFFEWIGQFEEQAGEGESLFLYVFDRKLDDISHEEQHILFALSLFDDPVPAEAVYFVCRQDIPSSDLFHDLLKRLAGYRFVESFEDGTYTLQALADYIVRQRFKTQKQTNITYLKKVIQYWQEKNDRQAEAEAYYSLADLQNDYDEWYDALESLGSAEKIWETLSDDGQTVQVMNLSKYATLKGTLLLKIGQWDKAIEYYEKSLQIQTALGDRQGMANAYGNLGNVYLQKGEWDKAVEYYEKSLQIQTDLDDRQGMANTYGNLGNVYLQKGEWDEAVKFYKKSLHIQTALDDRQGMANTYGNLGSVYRQKGEWDKAVEFYKKSLHIQTALGDRQGMASVMGNLGNVYLQKGEVLKGIDLLEKCLAIKREIGEQFTIMQALIALAPAYLQTGQTEKALSYLDEAEPLAIRFQQKEMLEHIQQLRQSSQGVSDYPLFKIMQILAEVAGEEAIKKGLESALEEIMTSPEKMMSFMQKLEQAGINMNELMPKD
ncbi:MAG: tetratricopeptide repeat protein [Desulfobacteraceae bacterium]|nr:tetratricopeptide repeat protein [Desulfobacteraceae bacterium]